jgi:hypothetical protein
VAQAFVEPIALPQGFLMVLLHSALKLRVLDESARLIFRNVGRMRLERVGVLETRHEDLVLAVGHDLVPCRIGAVRRVPVSSSIGCRPQTAPGTE